MKHSKAKFPMILGPFILVLITASTLKSDYFEINKQLEIFTQIFKEINLHYVDDQEPQVLMDAAINSMLETLDPFTNYIPENYVEDFRSQSVGHYGGIGALVRKKDDFVVVSSLHEGEAADKAGLRIGDEIIEVEGLSTKNQSVDDVSRLLKGAPGTPVSLKIKREGKTQTLKFDRTDVRMKNVSHFAILENGIGYIYLNNFAQRASDEVREAFQTLKSQGLKDGLILDLRGNPGGLLSEAVNVSNLFIDKDLEVVSTKGKIKEAQAVYKTQFNPIDRDIPLVILINGNSASASEIVAGVMQDLDRGLVVGERSFGKGLVQQTKPLSYGTQLKFTIAKYYTPSGRCIQSINYGERDEFGRVNAIPDSLRNIFKSKNGRVVKDGGGIDPDIEVIENDLPLVLLALIEKDVIFKYANQEFAQNPKKPFDPQQYTMTDTEYARFIKFANNHDFTFRTASEEILIKLQETVKYEKYTSLDSDIQKLTLKVNELKSNDLTLYSPQIKTWIGAEMALRYSYERGQVMYNLRFDKTSKAAVEVLKVPEKYKQALNGNKL